jgi:hypothetical protein
MTGRPAGLVVLRPQYLACPWVDEMHARAGGAGHGFVGFGLGLARILRDPALHIETGVRTAKDESDRHDPAIKAGAPVTTLVQRKRCFD